MNLPVENGLIFAIPLAEKMVGFGQLIAWQRPIFYMAGYDIHSESPDVSECGIKNAKPVLLGNFFDILIRNGRWTAIRQQETPEVPFPCFKIKIEDKFYVESWDRQQIREANSEECAALQFRWDYSAIILENALKAYFGLRHWESRFDCLKVAEIVESSRSFAR